MAVWIPNLETSRDLLIDVLYAPMQVSARRRNYVLVSHRTDALIEWIRDLLRHSFVLSLPREVATRARANSSRPRSFMLRKARALATSNPSAKAARRAAGGAGNAAPTYGESARSLES